MKSVNRDLEDLFDFFENKYDRDLLEKGVALEKAVKKNKIDLSNIRNVNDLIIYLDNGEISKEDAIDWLERNLEETKKNFEVTTLSMPESEGKKFINSYLDKKTYYVIDESINKEVTEDKTINETENNEVKIENVTPKSIVSQDPMVLEIQDHKKALSTVKTKKVVYALLAGVCTVSTIIMTFALKTPAEIINACSMFIDKVGIDEFKEKVGSPLEFVTYIFSLLGIKIFSNMSVNQLKPEENLEKEIEKLENILNSAEETDEIIKSK